MYLKFGNVTFSTGELAALQALLAAEVAILDGSSAGTVVASKVVVVDANKDIGTFRNLTLSGNLVTGATTLSETDLAKIDGITNGTAAASKAVVLDANKAIAGLGVVQLGDTATAALALGGGTSGTPLTSAATGKNFVGFWTQSTDATGSDMRGMYFRHYLAGAGGAQSGEAIRAFCTVSASAANAARGIHSSLSIGASGDIAGLGCALDGTLHVPDAALGGTTAAVSADIDAAGTSSDNGGTMSFYRASLQGDATGVAALELTADFMQLTGHGAAGVGKMFHVNTAADATHGLRIDIGGVPYAFMLTNVIPS